jgi:hypothetical protein
MLLCLNQLEPLKKTGEALHWHWKFTEGQGFWVIRRIHGESLLQAAVICRSFGVAKLPQCSNDDVQIFLIEKY